MPTILDLAGLPALSVPAGFDDAGRLPMGLQLIGPPRSDAELLRVAAGYEALVPALLAREILLRGNYVRRGRMLIILIACVVLAVSATYELIEWATALALGQGADEFLATQGDPWDTQSDMLLALIGAGSALILLSRLHDSGLRQLRPTEQS